LMCAQDFNKAFSFFNLGVADYNLNHMDEAEKMLSHVNYMDPTHAETWAYLTLVNLARKPKAKVHAAYECMNEAIRLGLKNEKLQIDIKEEWKDSGSRKGTKESLEALAITQGGARFKQKILDFMA